MAIHDTGYKELFSYPEMVQELLIGFIPQEISIMLDFKTLKMHPGNFITPLFKEKIEDCVWSVKLLPEHSKKQQELYLFLLLEFQSSDDKTMPLRMLHYTASFYHHLIKERKLNLRKDKLPLVFPCVLYNGELKWQTPTSFLKLLPTMPSFLKKFQPQLNYYLIDEKQLSEETLKNSPFLLSGVFGIEQADTDMAVIKTLQLIQQKLAKYPEEHKERMGGLLYRWVAHYLHNSALDIILDDIDLVEEDPMRLRKFVLEQMEESRREGREEAKVVYLSQGRELAIKETVLNLHRNMNLAADQIAAALQLPLDKVQTIITEQS